MQMCERLLLDHPNKLNGKVNPLHKAIIFCLTAQSQELRKRCRPCVKKLVSVLGGTQLALSLLKEFTVFLDSAKVQLLESEKENKGNDTGGSGAEISPRTLVHCVTTLCSGTNLTPEDAQLIARDSLICCHHPSLSKYGCLLLFNKYIAQSLSL